MEKWSGESFVFSEWKGRGINVLKGTGLIVEELEEAQVDGLLPVHMMARRRLAVLSRRLGNILFGCEIEKSFGEHSALGFRREYFLCLYAIVTGN